MEKIVKMCGKISERWSVVDDVHFEAWWKNVAVLHFMVLWCAIVQGWSIMWKRCGAGKDCGFDSRVLHIGFMILSSDMTAVLNRKVCRLE